MAIPWADQPYPLIPTPMVDGTKASNGTLQVSTVMALAHNLLIRYLNSIYLQATGISKTKDVTDFLFYCQSWCSVIHEHHAGEEKALFPRIEKLTDKTDIMEESVEEHKAFSAGIDEFERYVRDTSAEEFDGQKLRSLIDAFASALLKHLRAEVSTLVTIGERYGGDKLHAIFDAFETEMMKESRATWDPHVVIPAGIGSTDRSFEDGKHAHWPPFPWYVPYLSQLIFARKYAGSWRFSPCRNFRKRDLQFVGDDYEHAVAAAVKLL